LPQTPLESSTPSDIRLDAVVTAYTLGVAGVIGLVLGLIPVAAALRANLVTVLREEGRTGTSALGARTLRRGLVVAQVECAFVLLIGAGLLFASFRKVLTVNPGFAAEQVLTAAVSLPGTRYADTDAIRHFTAEALRRLRALPGVRAAGATDTIPFGNSHSASGIMAEGSRAKPGESVAAPSRVRVSDGYFEAIGARLVKGRFFDEHDAATARPVAIIDERLARRFWPDQDPIGRHLYEPADGPNPAAITDKTELITVVGVIGEIKMRDLTDSDNPVGAYYLSMAQGPDDGLTFAIRATGNPAALSGAVRRAIAELDSQLPVFEVHPMAYWTERALASRRSPTVMAIAFGAVALLLSAVGIYGVLAYLVTKRTKEIGIRVALGSSAAAVYWLVLREGLVLIGAGLLVGGAGAAALGQAFESQLFGVTATDPIVLLVVGVLLAAVALTACAVPARRATKINPVVALAD
jgi:predicted permease